jgi:hypothetical protein
LESNAERGRGRTGAGVKNCRGKKQNRGAKKWGKYLHLKKDFFSRLKFSSFLEFKEPFQ